MNQKQNHPDNLDKTTPADDKPADKPDVVDENAPAPVAWPDGYRHPLTGATVAGPADDN